MASALKWCLVAASALGAQAKGRRGLPLDLHSAIEARFAHHDPEDAQHLLRRLGLTDNGGQTSVSCMASVIGTVGGQGSPGQSACSVYLWNSTSNNVATGGKKSSTWVAAGNIDPIYGTTFPADNTIPAPTAAQLQPPYAFGSWIGQNMPTYALHQGLPVIPQTGWGGGPNVPLSPPSMKVWGVHATPSTNANLAAGDASVLLSWFLGGPTWNVTVGGKGGGFNATPYNGYTLVCPDGFTSCPLGTLQKSPAATAFIPAGVTFQATIMVGTSPTSLANVNFTGLTCLQYLRVFTVYKTNYLSPYICHATVQSLARKTTYYYDITTTVGGTPVVGPPTGAYTMPSATYSAAATHFKFTTMSGPSTGCPNEASCPSVYPVPLVLTADLGQTFNSSMTAQNMAAYISTMNVQAVLVPGDYTYADNYDSINSFMEEDAEVEYVNPMRWDSWAVMWQSVHGQSQWVHAAGNHDLEYVGSGVTKYTDNSTTYGFLSPDQRYPHQAWSTRYPNGAVDKSSYGDSWATVYYSQNLGPVHLIVLDAYIPFVEGTEQYNWFKQDIMAVDRSKQPWLIVMFHAPIYHTYVTHYKEQECMRMIYEPLFYQYRVDFVLNGHVHAYERTHPMYNYTQDACGPVHIVIGDGGNVEGPYRDFMDDVIPGSPGVTYCKAASAGTIKAGVPMMNTWSPSYQRDAQPKTCTTLSFQPAQDGTTAGILANPYDPSNSTFWCQSKQAAWSAYREPSFGFASLTLTSDNTATYSWYRNIDQTGSASGLKAADTAQYTRYNGPCMASTTTTTTMTMTATMTTTKTNVANGAPEPAGWRASLALAAAAAAAWAVVQ